MHDRERENGTGSLWGADHAALCAEKRRAVRQELDKILIDPLFRNSKRCSDFLRYTVNRALDETTEAIKERTLGAEVFGKEPDYDTNSEPVVRVTAAEVRKRLKQFYQSAEHAADVRVDYARGSYVPEFVFPDQRSSDRNTKTGASPDRFHLGHGMRRWVWGVIVAAPYVTLLIFLLGLTRETAKERFWSPLVHSKQSVLFCVPTANADPPAAQTSSAVPATQAPQTKVGMGRRTEVAFSDSIALSSAISVLNSNSVGFHVRSSDDVTLDELKQGPVVLIGGFSNRWTRELQGGRFTFSRDAAFHYVADRNNPASRQWGLSDLAVQSVDYGLISRIFNPTTGTFIVTIAGIHGFGTEAAAECVSGSECLEAAAKLAPGNWKAANLQIVLQTSVIDGTPGKAKVLAAQLW